MQPIGPSIAFEKSRLEIVPMEIKLQVLKYLNIPEIANTAVLNKFWQKMASDNRVWKQVATQLNIKCDPKNAQQEVMDHQKYHSTVEVVMNYAKLPTTFMHEELRKFELENGDKKAVEKYKFIIEYFRTSDYTPFFDVMANVFKNTPVLPKQIQALKQLIQDGCIPDKDFDVSLLISPADAGNLEIFQSIVNKFKHRIDTFSAVAKVLAIRRKYNAVPFLRILCNAGGRPDAVTLLNTTTTKYVKEYLQLLLDYTGEAVRKEAITKLKNNNEAIEIIKNAPPPTYGKDSK